MVGIVVVSHSREIASGTVALAGQMAGPDVRIEGAGGTPDGGLGTDADRVRAAIDAAEQGDGVIVLGDLGSAILTARAVLAGRENGHVAARRRAARRGRGRRRGDRLGRARRSTTSSTAAEETSRCRQALRRPRPLPPRRRPARAPRGAVRAHRARLPREDRRGRRRARGGREEPPVGARPRREGGHHATAPGRRRRRAGRGRGARRCVAGLTD